MTRVEVFDPPLCCSTGVCGPNVDPVLIRFAADLHWLANQALSAPDPPQWRRRQPGVLPEPAAPGASRGRRAPSVSGRNPAGDPAPLLPGTRMSDFLEQPTRILFFTGKGGVGKTCLAFAPPPPSITSSSTPPPALGALIGASNFFELAVATAIALFGPASGAALAGVYKISGDFGANHSWGKALYIVSGMT
jgi:hypothetical protein